MKVIEGADSLEVSQMETRIAELERDLGKTASCLLKAKQVRKTKSSEVCRFQRQIQRRRFNEPQIKEAKAKVRILSTP